jgi:ferredoxin-nitrate reductase
MEDLARHWNLDVNKIPHWAEPTHIMDMLRYIEEGSFATQPFPLMSIIRK